MSKLFNINIESNTNHKMNKKNRNQKSNSTYITVSISNDKNEELEIIPPFTGLFHPCKDEKSFNNVFEMTGIDELIDYEGLDSFVDLIYAMTNEFYDEFFDELIIKFFDKKTDKPFAGIYAFLDEDEDTEEIEVMYHLIDFSEINKEDEYDCDDCLPMFEFMFDGDENDE